MAPVARPSRPSVRLTALVVAVVMRLDQITKRISPTTGPAKARSRPVSRRKEMRVDAGVLPAAFGKSRQRVRDEQPGGARKGHDCPSWKSA